MQSIKDITNKVKSPCLVGYKRFNESVQQFTCNHINGNNCECYLNYLSVLKNKFIKKKYN